MTRGKIINLVETTFIKCATKIVSKTDVEKGAYLPNKQQREIMSSLNFTPIHDNRIKIKELFSNRTFTVSYYPSERVGSGRSAEIRMGLSDLISYINIGDEILFTHDNQYVYIYNLTQKSDDAIETKIYSQIDMDLLYNRAIKINPKPQQVQQTISTYPRNNTLKNYVKRRSNYSCEMPSCNYVPFIKNSDEPYVEIHHVIPLSEGGEDTVLNTVALCPNCHRALHYAKNRETLREKLLDYLRNL